MPDADDVTTQGPQGAAEEERSERTPEEFVRLRGHEFGIIYAPKPSSQSESLIEAVWNSAIEAAAAELLDKASYGSKLHTGEPMTELESAFLEEEVVPWLRALAAQPKGGEK